ncbi:MAG: hypothetical protein KA259_03220 [Caldilineaceae bacterium]|nr:hypothetical protein [Caldilineaceae bacterium]
MQPPTTRCWRASLPPCGWDGVACSWRCWTSSTHRRSDSAASRRKMHYWMTTSP